MSKARLSILFVAAAAAIAVAVWWLAGRHKSAGSLVLYGNVDLRQADLPFNASERVTEVLVQEGDHVKAGQVMARLDPTRMQPQVAKAEAEVAAQQEVVNRLHAGTRPEEVAQGRANVLSAEADGANARSQYDRLVELQRNSAGRAVSKQDIDSAKAALDVAQAKLAVSRKALDLQIAGPRKEDIAQAEAQLRSDEAQLALLRRQLADMELHAPINGVVRSRLVEPGEIASPQKAAFTLAITDPKWIRAYVSDPDLGAVREGLRATITTDAFASHPFEGWVGFISPTAEFTPKTVQTEELRSSLVYEVRVFVKDPGDQLRLGMPATIHLDRRSGVGGGASPNAAAGPNGAAGSNATAGPNAAASPNAGTAAATDPTNNAAAQ
ncbi:MAG: efflux RND transporter periplasmic adaptor subunit [Proteobacteria bacterium]|nr:efflux RND transporter periplasmic adaptor subunit [Pseudomonadota bacterium]